MACSQNSQLYQLDRLQQEGKLILRPDTRQNQDCEQDNASNNSHRGNVASNVSFAKGLRAALLACATLKEVGHGHICIKAALTS